MTAPKVPVLSREDARAIIQYAMLRRAELEQRHHDAAGSPLDRCWCCHSYLEQALAIEQFAIALANAARKGE